MLIRFLSIGVTVYEWLLIAYAFLSWVPSLRDSQLGLWIEAAVEPILSPLRRLNLRLGGLDFTVILAIFLLRMGYSWLLRLIFLV